MKKAISLLLCLCVAFSLLPTSPAKATNGGSGGATTPEVTELYYAKYVYQSDGRLVQEGNIGSLTGKTLSHDIYAAPYLALYSDAAGTTRINNFSFSQTNQTVANLNRTSLGDMFLSVNPLKCGETQVTVDLGNNKSCSFNLKIGMPEIGFYTSPERKENNLAKETYFTPGAEKTVYLMKNVGFTQEEATAVAIIEDKKNEVTKQVPVQISETGGYYVPFKLSAGAKDDLFFQVNSSGRGVSLLLKRDGLRYKYYNEQQDENNTEPTYSPLNLSFGYNLHIVFCYVTDGISKNVSQNELTFPNNISAEMIGSGANSYFEISADKIGAGEISYTSVQTSAKMNVTVSLPFLGFYKSQTRDENNYISNNFYFSEGNKSFYLLKDGGFTEQEINNIRFQEGGNMVTHERISKANSQNFDLKLTISDPAQDQFYIIVTVNGPGAGLNCVKATGKVVCEYKVGGGGWQSSNDNKIYIQQLPENTPKEVQIRFKKDGQLVTPTSAKLNDRYSKYAQLSAGTDGIYTLTFNKLINLTIDAVVDGTSSSIKVNNWVNTAKNSEFDIGGRKFELGFAVYNGKDNLESWPMRNASHSFAKGTSLKYALAVFEKTTEAGSGNISYKLDMNKTKALSDVAVTPSIDSAFQPINVNGGANEIKWFTTTVADCGTTLFSATATLEGKSHKAYMTIQVNPTKTETIIDLSNETTLTIEQLNAEIANHSEPEESTKIVIKLPAIDITANGVQNVLIGKRNIKLEGMKNAADKQTTIHGGLIVEAAWKFNGQITEIQGIKFDGHGTKKARGKGTGISAGGTVRAQPAILGCTFTGFEVGMNTTRLGGLVAYCNFIDNGVGLQIGETLGMERRCYNRFIVNDTAIEILKNDDAQYGTAIGLSTAYIWNFMFIDNKTNINNKVDKPFYMPRALYMKMEDKKLVWMAPLSTSFIGKVVYEPYYSTDGLYNTMREDYDGPTTFLGNELVMNKDTMSTSVEVDAIKTAVSNNNPLTMEIMGRSKSNEQELAAKWTFTKDGTAGALGRATLLAEPAVFDPTVTITSSTEIISAVVKSPPTGVKTRLTIPCNTMNSAVVTLDNNVVPSKWDSTSKQVSFDVTEAGTYQISPPICVSETLSESDLNLSITINLPVSCAATAHVAVYDGSRLIELKTAEVVLIPNTSATAKINLNTSKYPKTYKVQVLLLDNATQNPLTDKWSKQY